MSTTRLECAVEWKARCLSSRRSRMAGQAVRTARASVAASFAGPSSQSLNYEPGTAGTLPLETRKSSLSARREHPNSEFQYILASASRLSGPSPRSLSRRSRRPRSRPARPGWAVCRRGSPRSWVRCPCRRGCGRRGIGRGTGCRQAVGVGAWRSCASRQERGSVPSHVRGCSPV
jgi:hypothetical protein